MPRKPSSWRKGVAAVVVPFAIVGLALAEPPPVPTPSDRPPTMAQLLQRIEGRDTLIADLQQRIKALERQIDSLSAARLPTADQPQPAAPVPSAAVPSTPAAPPPQASPPAAESAAAPGQFEVDEAAAERALERALIRTGALLLPFRQAEIQVGFDYTRSEEEVPTFFLEGETQFLAEQSLRHHTLSGNLSLLLGLPLDLQLEFGVPYQSLEREEVITVSGEPRAKTSDQGAGFGDVRFGLAKGLLRERRWWPNLIGRLTWDTDSGETDDGIPLGSGFNELRGSLVLSRRQDPLVFIGSLSYQRAFEKNDIRPGDEVGLSVGVHLAASPETSLRLVLDQAFIGDLEVGNRSIDGTDQVIGVLSLGASSIIGRGKFLDFTVGAGLTDQAPDYSVGVSVSVLFDVPTPRF